MQKPSQWHTMAVDEVLQALQTTRKGLEDEEAEGRLAKFGPNELIAEKRISPLTILISQFREILILILLIATVLSAVIGEIVDAIVILAIVIASAVLGFTQEYRAERALEALKKMLAPTITVLRNGKEKEIPSNNLVPGDVILLGEGDRVPADARLMEMANLQVDEASLTGESIPVAKGLDPLPEDTNVADMKNTVFSGTVITSGKGRGIVTATGMNTEFGKIAKEVTAVVEEKTPLEERTENLGKWLGAFSLSVCFLVAGFGILRAYLLEGMLTGGFVLEMILFGVALAVAAVPEALPAIVTGALAIGMREMAKENALVRRMPAVETLGSTTVICSDKTGTLTKGEMTVRKIYVDDKMIDVSGVGYAPRGELHAGGTRVHIHEGALPLLLTYGILCSDAKLEQAEEKYYIRGDPTEGALVVLAEKAGFHQEDIRSQHPRLGELPFSSERKRMSTVHSTQEGKKIICMKGAPEFTLERCSFINEGGRVEKLTATKREEILKINAGMAGDALRVLGVAYKELSETIKVFDDESLENDLIFIGLVGMMDPPREEAIKAIKVCRKAGMKPIMITGDHKLTAVAIAKEMGIFNEGNLVLTGEELEKISGEEFEQIVDQVAVYARVNPIHKLRIVSAWKDKGQVVAMTGDGVNDAPAVKSADIGVAMGITGTDVTKEVADMVLTDDNFATIVKAIERGRWVFDNIKKFLTFLLQCNLIEIVVIGGGVLLGLPLPLVAAQILWVNLTTDGLPALALGVSPPDPDIMQRPPRDPKETVFTKEVKIILTAIPLILSPILLLTFVNDLAISVEEARATLFLIFVFFELVVALNCRSLTHSIFKAKPHKSLWLAVFSSALLTLAVLFVPAMRDAFRVAIPIPSDIALAASLSLLPLILLEALKSTLIKRSNKLA